LDSAFLFAGHYLLCKLIAVSLCNSSRQNWQ